MALHEPGWVCGSHTGSALRLLSRSLLEPLLGVMVSMTWPSVKASPSQWKWEIFLAKSTVIKGNARVMEHPSDEGLPAHLRSRAFACVILGIGVTMTISQLQT